MLFIIRLNVETSAVRKRQEKNREPKNKKMKSSQESLKPRAENVNAIIF